jgi:hypothetical protein
MCGIPEARMPYFVHNILRYCMLSLMTRDKWVMVIYKTLPSGTSVYYNFLAYFIVPNMLEL